MDSNLLPTFSRLLNFVLDLVPLVLDLLLLVLTWRAVLSGVPPLLLSMKLCTPPSRLSLETSLSWNASNRLLHWWALRSASQPESAASHIPLEELREAALMRDQAHCQLPFVLATFFNARS